MNLNDMVVFERVVRDRSFSQAARALGISKSSASARVAALEDRLGARLLHRTTRSVRPTDVGEAYYVRCARIISEAEEADRAVTDTVPTPRGLLRLTAPRLLGYTYLVSIVSEFLATYPEIEVDIVLTERRVDLIEEGVDVALRIGPLPDSSLRVRALAAADMMCVASTRYLAARGQPKQPEDLKDHLAIRVGHGGPVRWHFSGPDGPIGVTVKGRLSVNSLVMAREAACESLGIAWMPRFLAASGVSSGRLVEVLSDFAAPPLTINAIFPSNRYLSAKVRVFIDLAAKRLKTSLATSQQPINASSSVGSVSDNASGKN